MSEITQAQYNTAKQSQRNISIRINLLNFSKQIIDSIEGQVISGSLTSDANSNMRNTCDIQMVVTDSSFNVEAEGKIWMDRYIQIYIGVEDLKTHQIIWTNKGIYLLNQPTYGYSAESKELSFQGVDMMALLTDMRGGMLAEAYLIPAGSNVRDVIITILGVNGINEYVVDDCKNSDGSIQPVPYDMNFDAGSTWWDVLEALQSILPNYQMYFDVDGVFHYETTPYRADESVRMDDDIWKQNVISENVSYDFETIKNSVKVLGRTHSVNYYATEVSVDENIVNLTIPGVTAITDGLLIGFVLKQSIYGEVSLNVNNLGAKSLTKMDGNSVTSLAKDEYWTASYNGANNSWQFLGHLQAVGEWMDDNPHSPFFVGNPAGEIKIVLYGGDYDNIMSDELATQRAEWEIYQRCRMNDSITLTSVPIYWSEVNWMVAYTPLGQDVVNQYLIRSITTDLTHDGTQTYNLIRWYPYYIQYVPASGSLVITFTNENSLSVAVKPSSAKTISSVSPHTIVDCYTRPAKFPNIVYELMGDSIVSPVYKNPKTANSYVKTIKMVESAKATESSFAQSQIDFLQARGKSTERKSVPSNVYYGRMLLIYGDAVDKKKSLAISDMGRMINARSSATEDEKQLAEVHMGRMINARSSATEDEKQLAEVHGVIPAVTNNLPTVKKPIVCTLHFVSPIIGVNTAEISQKADASNRTTLMTIVAGPSSILGWEYPVQTNNKLLIKRVYSSTETNKTLLLQ